MNLDKLIISAIEEASKSTHQHRVGAVIYNNKGIISKGHNEACTWRKKLHPRYKKWPNSVHAEVAAILSAKTDLKGTDIMVIRINKKGQLRMAKPCAFCTLYLEHIGIRKLTYSVNDGLETVIL